MDTDTEKGQPTAPPYQRSANPPFEEQAQLAPTTCPKCGRNLLDYDYERKFYYCRYVTDCGWAEQAQARANEQSESGWRRNYDPGSPDKLLDAAVADKGHRHNPDIYTDTDVYGQRYYKCECGEEHSQTFWAGFTVGYEAGLRDGRGQ